PEPGVHSRRRASPSCPPGGVRRRPPAVSLAGRPVVVRASCMAPEPEQRGARAPRGPPPSGVPPLHTAPGARVFTGGGEVRPGGTSTGHVDRRAGVRGEGAPAPGVAHTDVATTYGRSSAVSAGSP